MSYDDFLERTTGQLQFYLMERVKSTTGNKTDLDHQMVRSNHFQYDKPIPAAPNPTLYLVPSDAKKSPQESGKGHIKCKLPSLLQIQLLIPVVIHHSLQPQKHFQVICQVLQWNHLALDLSY